MKKQKKIKITIGSDHAGFAVKKKLITFLNNNGFKVTDVGARSDKPSDYPDYALKVSKTVSSGRSDRGLLVCGSGLGMAIMANKVKKVRAAAVWSIKTAKLASEHNWANVLAVSSRLTSFPIIKKMVIAWLKTPFDTGGRHERRVKKILNYEGKK